MRQLFVALVATAALVASQNSAEAIFEKNLIDNFNDPDSVVGSTTPGGTITFLEDPNEALSRTLIGAGAPSPALIAGSNGPLVIGLEADEVAELQYNLGPALAAAMAANNSVYLVLVNETFDDDPGSMIVEAFDDGGSLGTLAYSGEENAILSWVRTPQLTNGLRFVFTAGSEGFAGSVDRVVANPEPATMALMGLGVLGGAIGYRRRRKDDEVTPVEA